jgi:hypothetical protein
MWAGGGVDLDEAEGEVEAHESAGRGGGAGSGVGLLCEPLPLLPVHERVRALGGRGAVVRPHRAAAAAVTRVRIEALVGEEGGSVGAGDVGGGFAVEAVELGVQVEVARHVGERVAEEGEEDLGMKMSREEYFN